MEEGFEDFETVTTDKKRKQPKKETPGEYDPRFPASDPTKVKVIKKKDKVEKEVPA